MFLFDQLFDRHAVAGGPNSSHSLPTVMPVHGLYLFAWVAEGERLDLRPGEQIAHLAVEALASLRGYGADSKNRHRRCSADQSPTEMPRPGQVPLLPFRARVLA